LIFRPAIIISAAITAAARQVVWKVAPSAGSKNRKFLFALPKQPMDVFWFRAGRKAPATFPKA
jgi:hypothetical protein